MKKLVLIPLFFILIISIPLLWLYINVQPVSSQVNMIDFSVPKGASATQIGASLFQKGLIKNVNVFKLYMQVSGLSGNIQVGSYKLSPSYNLFQIVEGLYAAPMSTRVTIPEGFTNAEIADKFARSLNRDQTFVNQFISLSKNDEGYLFPDTYLVELDATPGAIIQKMKSEFDAKTKDLKPTPAQVIMASIIERETKGEEERPIVSGILMNRLEAGMPLQVDVARETYERIGLPNKPIANPGLTSLKAAVNPIATDYWYYLHDPSATIHYAKTLDEHNANIQKYLK